MIPFNRPFLTGKELENIREAVQSGKISGNGVFTQKCHNFFVQQYGFKKCLLTSSCTDALEMAAILCDIKPGDEVIMPSYTFVSTANAFVLRGAKIVFVDSRGDHPGIDELKIKELITPRTKVIVPVHYAGVACDMDLIMEIASQHNLFVVEDAAQAVDSFYKGRPLGSIGHLACFSFHETKNIISGEGGMLVVNDDRFVKRAEIVWEKGTNRAEFFRGEVNKYGWVDIGSSFLPSEITAAFLYAQLENLGKIQQQRKALWNSYYERLKFLVDLGLVKIPIVPDFATNNGHMFYMVCRSLSERTALIESLKSFGIMAVFHYQSLHQSVYYADKHDGRILPNCDIYNDCLVRLPLFFSLTDNEVDYIIDIIKKFYKQD
jgi:dTDP-4-amino-4,6-dideoxygalactose transaminase